MHFSPHWFRLFYLRKILSIVVGEHTSINMHCFITGSNIKIGNNSVVNRFCYLDGRVSLRIGNNVNISHYTIIQTLTHDVNSSYFNCVEGPIVIEDDAWIGARAIILPGVTIGRGSVIAAGAIVTKNVANYEIVAGVPAKVVGMRNNELLYRTEYFPFFDTDIQ